MNTFENVAVDPIIFENEAQSPIMFFAPKSDMNVLEKVATENDA